MNPSQQPSQSNFSNNPLEVMSPGEQRVMEIKRSSIGLLGFYISSAFIILLLLAVVALIPHYVTSLTAQDKTGLFAGAVIVIVIVMLYMYVMITVYKGNRWIVTSDSITQITQVGLFRKRTSQLSLANLEDVTFEQNSMFQTMLGYGTLKVETAGEHSKFYFVFCPNPAECARKIIAAHEQFINARPEGDEQQNRGTVDTQAFNQQAYPAQPQPAPLQQPPQPPVQQDNPNGQNLNQ